MDVIQAKPPEFGSTNVITEAWSVYTHFDGMSFCLKRFLYMEKPRSMDCGDLVAGCAYFLF